MASETKPIVPEAACGAFHQADYGPLYCDRPKDHADPHRAYGSQGEITWRPCDPFESGFYRAVAESMLNDALGDEVTDDESR